MDKFIFKATLITAWALLPIAILCVAMRTAYDYVTRTIDEVNK